MVDIEELGKALEEDQSELAHDFSLQAINSDDNFGFEHDTTFEPFASCTPRATCNLLLNGNHETGSSDEDPSVLEVAKPTTGLCVFYIARGNLFVVEITLAPSSHPSIRTPVVATLAHLASQLPAMLSKLPPGHLPPTFSLSRTMCHIDSLSHHITSP